MDKLASLIVLCAVVAAMMPYIGAQKVHIVGDSVGWAIPPNSSFSYAKWAAGRTFVVGDVLVFNFVTEDNDLAQVPKYSYDRCSDDDEIGKEIEIGPANVTLTTAGTYYFISSDDGHCQAGQKLAITVVPPRTSPVTPATPTPTPTTPTPTPTTPTPTPTTPTTTPAPTPNVHIVGDSLGWTIPPNSSFSYAKWAWGETFVVGDILVFNFVTKKNDVVRVPKYSYDRCSDDDEIGEEFEIGPTNVTLNSVGNHYFISSFDGHCKAGQKLAITVTGTPRGNQNAPGSTRFISSPSTSATPSSRVPSSTLVSASFLLVLLFTGVALVI